MEKQPSRKEIARLEGATRSYKAKVHHSPDRDSLVKEFGRRAVKDNPDGSWVCTIKDPQKMKRAAQMMEGVHKEESRRGKEYRESIETERVNFPDGSQRDIYGHLMDQTRRKVRAMRGVGRHGKGATEYFGAPDRKPFWTRECLDCGKTSGMWVQYNKPHDNVPECGHCESANTIWLFDDNEVN